MNNMFIYKDEKNTHLIKYCGNEEEVTIPEGVTVIGEAAFASCTNLKRIYFPSTLLEIKNLAFYNCIKLDIATFLNCEIADNAFLGCTNLKKENFTLKEMTIGQIESEHLTTFFVKDYQRGYRWSKNEIEELLNDINETVSRYCVQPLIVKVCSPEKCERYIDKNGLHESVDAAPTTAYELIDGQQRLTTLLLILNTCHKESDRKTLPVNYEIYYELLRKIDKHYIEKAENTISDWIKEKGSEFNISNFVSTIRNKLFFIWYEMNTDKNIVVEEEFRNINDGQTPLTNAELFKALLLNPENTSIYPTDKKKDMDEKLSEMSFQWDDIEQSLHNEDFWFFIANDECQERTRLDYLFELYARNLEGIKKKRRSNAGKSFNSFQENELKKLDKTRDRYSFLAVKSYIEYLDKHEFEGRRFESVEKVWNEMVDLYNRLYSWYSDGELYHTIGYLVAIEKSNRGKSIVPEIIVCLFKDHINDSLITIKSFVQNEIYEHLKNHIVEEKNSKTIFAANYYERNKKDIRDFLLYINVWSTYISKEKFPFVKFKNTKHPDTKETISWDIEHISARNLKEVITDEELEKIRDWWEIEATKTDVNNEDNLIMKENDKVEQKWDAEAWKNFARRVNEDEPDNSISNLVLLDSATNRSYGDALFFGKRKEIIERDKKSAYIPICTKNVFLKYYTVSPDFSVAWSQKDKDSYFANILLCLKSSIINEKNFKKELLIEVDDIINRFLGEENK